jgi:hypothetical protein
MTNSPTVYFEDMWLGIQDELSSYDSFSPSEYIDHQSTSSSPEHGSAGNNTSDMSPSTYERLLEIQKTPNPSHDRMRSPDRKERIEAIRELYNKTTTILNASSNDTLKKVANRLYRAGLVKQANALVEKVIDKHVEQDMEFGYDFCSLDS